MGHDDVVRCNLQFERERRTGRADPIIPRSELGQMCSHGGMADDDDDDDNVIEHRVV